MKKFKLVLAALTIVSSMAFADFSDVPADHWASEAVKSLQSKGLLAPSLDSAVVFNGDGVFSRYEVASMLNLTLNATDDKLSKKASKEDIEALKLLVKNFSPELVKMGARVDALEKKLAEASKNSSGDVEKKLGKKIESIEEKLGRVKITGDFTAFQEIGMKDNAPGMHDIDYKGNLAVIGNVSKNISVMTKLGIEQGKDVEVKATEIKAKSDVFALSIFKDKDKDPESLIAFSNTLGLFDGKTVAPKTGVLFNGTNKNDITTTNYVGLLFKTDSGDFYGLQVKNDIEPLKKMGLDSFVRFSYAEKILKYQYEKEKDPTNAKAFYTGDGYIKFAPLSNLDMAAAVEYGTRRGPGTSDIKSDEKESLVNSRDALYTYLTSNLKITNKIKVYGSFGYYNTGEYFDIAGMGNNSKAVFSENGIIKLEADKRAVLTKVGTAIEFINAAVTYASYRSNFKSSTPQENIVLEADATFGKLYKPSISYLLERDERTSETVLKDSTDTDLEKKERALKELANGKVEANKGKTTITFANKINPLSNLELNANITLKDDLDTADKKDTGNKMIAYGDTLFNLSSDAFVKGAFRYTSEGLKLTEEKSYNKDKLNKIETGIGMEIKGIKAGETSLGKVNLGARYSTEDKKGELNGAEGNTEKKDDKQNYSAFIAHEISFGKLKVTYGGAYRIENKWNADTKKVEDADKTNNILYAVGLEYDFGNSVVAKGSYGNPVIAASDADFMLDKTSFADGEQKLARVELSAKF